MPSPLGTGLASLGRVLDPDGLAHVVREQSPSQGGRHLDIRQTLADAAPGPDAKGAEGALSGLDVGLANGAARLEDGAGDPALGRIRKRVGVVVLVVVDGVVRSADDGTLGQRFAIDRDAAGQDLARQDTADRWGQTHGLVDAGAQVGQSVELGTLFDVLDAGEGGTDLLGHASESGGVAAEVEESGGHGGGGGVGTGDDTSFEMAPD